MLINLRNALMTGKRLPYDAEVEFLESTGTQWIDTGVLLQFPISADMTLAMVSPYGTLDSLPVFGFRYGGGSASSKFAIWFNKSQLRFALNYGSYDSGWKGSSVQSGQQVHLRTDMAKLYIDGVLVADGGTVTTSDASNTLTLFQMRDASSVANRGQCVRYYSCKLYDANGTLVRDYIPVRVGSGASAVGYLYDRVSGKLFGNAGTGDFQYGQDVVPVEYIESHGTEYINAGFATTGNGLRVRLACEKTTSSTSEMAIAGRNVGDGFELYFGGGQCGLWNSSGRYVLSDVSIVQGTKYSIDASIYSSGASLTVNGSERTSSFTPSEPSAANVLMFRHSSQYYFVGRVYPCEMWNNDVLTRSFRPVRVGTEGAMMDVLTRRIYRNAGTGAFTYGNDLKYPIPAE